MDINKKLEVANEKYVNAFRQYGRSSKSLLVGTDRQNIRFYELLKNFSITSDSTILDVGCGFADLHKFCINYFGVTPEYTGIDYCSEFIKTIKNEQTENCTFIEGNFLTTIELSHYDFCVASGIFNAFNCEDSTEDPDYEFLRSVVEKMFTLCKVGISFNFITNKVDYKKEGVTYYSPARILDFCYTLSRNIIFNNTCMPFEATVSVFKDDSFNEIRVLNSFMCAHVPSTQNGLLTGKFD